MISSSARRRAASMSATLLRPPPPRPFRSGATWSNVPQLASAGDPNQDGDSPMLFDLRTYRVRPGTLAAQLDLYAREGFAAQGRHLGAPVFYGTVETGDVNAYVHLW